MGVYMLSQFEEIEADMDIVRELIFRSYHNDMNIIRLQQHAANRIRYLMDIIIPDIHFVPEDEHLPLPKEVIEKIPEVIYEQLKTDEKQCPICMEDFASDSKIRKIACNHLFHTLCLDKWLSANHNCPLCRSDVAE